LTDFELKLVARIAHECGIDVSGVSILEKRGRDAGRERVGLGDDGLGVIGDEDREDTGEKLLRRFTASNRRAVVSSNVG